MLVLNWRAHTLYFPYTGFLGSCEAEQMWQKALQIWQIWHTPGVLFRNIKTLSCFVQAVEEEDKMTPEQLAIKNVGKQVRTKFQASANKTFIYTY